jgi:hypothetical protein
MCIYDSDFFDLDMIADDIQAVISHTNKVQPYLKDILDRLNETNAQLRSVNKRVDLINDLFSEKISEEYFLNNFK